MASLLTVQETVHAKSDEALRAHMEMLSRHLAALQMTHGHLSALLETQRNANALQQEVERPLQPNKRVASRCEPNSRSMGRAREDDDDDDDDSDNQDCVTQGIRAIDCGFRSSEVAVEASAIDDFSRRKKRSAFASSQNSLDSTVSTVSSAGEEVPLYRTAGFSTQTTGEDAMGEEALGEASSDTQATVAPVDGDEFDDCLDEYCAPPTYRSCAFSTSAEEVEDGEEVHAPAAAYRVHDSVAVVQLCDAIAAVGALAEPGVLDTLPSDAVVEEQLGKVLDAIRALRT